MTRLSRSLAALALSPLLLASQASTDLAQKLAGRYYRQFPDQFVTGEKYTGEDIVEIVPVAPGAAYFRIHLDYINGHACNIWGVARAEEEALVYRDPHRFRGKQCVLSLERKGKSLHVTDHGEVFQEGSCQDYCGYRASLNNITLPYASKRPIRYLTRLRGSTEYKAALREWRTGSHTRP